MSEPNTASSEPECADRPALEPLLHDLRQLRETVIAEGAECLHAWGAEPTVSSVNLTHYLALRRQDLRPLQDRLARAGLSSLGRCEAHVLASLNQVICLLAQALGGPSDTLALAGGPGFIDGNHLLMRHADALLGASPPHRRVRIMVTLPSEAARDAALVRDLLADGMACARINCAHDDAKAWTRMIKHVRTAEQETGRACRILMDLPGHKIRTGPLAPALPVLHLKPKRDDLGRPLEPARARLSLPGAIAEDNAPALPIAPDVYGRIQAGDRLRFYDTRDKHRVLTLRQEAGIWWAEGWRSAYLTEGSVLRLERRRKRRWKKVSAWTLKGLAPGEAGLRLKIGDRLWLRRDSTPGGLISDAEGPLVVIGCTLPEALATVQAGHTVWIDDGKLGARVESVSDEGLMLRIHYAPGKGRKLLPDKGLNLPDTELDLPALSAQDLAVLDVVAVHADLVGFSFVEQGGDMTRLINELNARQAPHVGIVAKIETRRAVRNLPDILLGALGRHPLAVMIARGDLAVELGGERLAEIQEEILWLCEAAHVPAIWATQVLESLAKKGVINRPELTDAAMSARAECVMLNKGPYVREAVRALDDILSRMRAHQYKKESRLRALHW